MLLFCSHHLLPVLHHHSSVRSSLMTFCIWSTNRLIPLSFRWALSLQYKLHFQYLMSRIQVSPLPNEIVNHTFQPNTFAFLSVYSPVRPIRALLHGRPSLHLSLQGSKFCLWNLSSLFLVFLLPIESRSGGFSPVFLTWWSRTSMPFMWPSHPANKSLHVVLWSCRLTLLPASC